MYNELIIASQLCKDITSGSTLASRGCPPNKNKECIFLNNGKNISFFPLIAFGRKWVFGKKRSLDAYFWYSKY